MRKYLFTISFCVLFATVLLAQTRTVTISDPNSMKEITVSIDYDLDMVNVQTDAEIQLVYPEDCYVFVMGHLPVAYAVSDDNEITASQEEITEAFQNGYRAGAFPGCPGPAAIRNAELEIHYDRGQTVQFTSEQFASMMEQPGYVERLFYFATDARLHNVEIVTEDGEVIELPAVTYKIAREGG